MKNIILAKYIEFKRRYVWIYLSNGQIKKILKNKFKRISNWEFIIKP